jgi:raffinose/stachyose/melibiose transport system permease protein
MLSPRVRTLRDARREKNVLIAMFLFPTFLLLSIFIFYSIFNNFQISFYDWDGLGGMDNFIGLQNWSRLLSDSTFWRAAVNNIQLVFISIFIELPIESKLL